MTESEQKALRLRNLRTALIVAGVALFLFGSIIWRVWSQRL